MNLQPLNGSGPSDGLGEFAVAPGSSLRVTGNWEIGPITNVDECQFCSYIVLLFAGEAIPLVTKTSPVLNPNVGESGTIDRTFRAGLPSAGTGTIAAGYQLGATFDPAGPVVTPFPGALSGSYDVRGPWTEPAITGTLGTNGWYTSDVGVSWPLTEPEGYAVTAKTGCDPVTISPDTDGQTLTCSLTSTMGTGTFPLTIKRDATKPTLAPTAPSSVDLGAVVSATPNASDALSGLASETCGPMPTSQAGTFPVTCTAYTYVWKTEKSWAGTCRTLVLKLTDNVEHTVDFKFSK
jgi:hypothetical protein